MRWCYEIRIRNAQHAGKYQISQDGGDVKAAIRKIFNVTKNYLKKITSNITAIQGRFSRCDLPLNYFILNYGTKLHQIYDFRFAQFLCSCDGWFNSIHHTVNEFSVDGLVRSASKEKSQPLMENVLPKRKNNLFRVASSSARVPIQCSSVSKSKSFVLIFSVRINFRNKFEWYKGEFSRTWETIARPDINEWQIWCTN